MGSPREDEKVIMEEDCNEDKLGSGYLILTNQRLIFQKGKTRLLTLSRKMSEVVLDIALNKISYVSTEGFLAKKLVVEVSDPSGVVHKFGVFGTGKWRKTVEEAIKSYSGSGNGNSS